jgi:hypothetical protein
MEESDILKIKGRQRYRTKKKSFSLQSLIEEIKRNWQKLFLICIFGDY